MTTDRVFYDPIGDEIRLIHIGPKYLVQTGVMIRGVIFFYVGEL